MKNIKHLILNEADDKGGGGGGSGYDVEPPKPSEQPAPAAGDTPPETPGDKEYDDFGYEITKPKEGAPNKEGTGDPKPESEKPPEEKVENPGTGYDPEKPPEPPVEPKPAEKPPEKNELGYELNFEGIGDDEKTKIVEFAKANKASKELMENYLALRKTELADQEKANAEMEAEYKRQQAAIKAGWHKELKEDPNFGGEKFSYNIHRAEKVLHEVMPETKKELTKRGSMLPPYVMRDLAKLADRLYATPKLVQGEAPKPKAQEEQEGNDPLEFYNQKS